MPALVLPWLKARRRGGEVMSWQRIQTAGKKFACGVSGARARGEGRQARLSKGVQRDEQTRRNSQEFARGQPR